MSLFDNVRVTKFSPELKLMVAIKYGRPDGSDEYLNRLPVAVIESTFKKLNRDRLTVDIESKKVILGMLLYSDTVADVVNETLYEYHTLLARG